MLRSYFIQQPVAYPMYDEYAVCTDLLLGECVPVIGDSKTYLSDLQWTSMPLVGVKHFYGAVMAYCIELSINLSTAGVWKSMLRAHENEAIPCAFVASSTVAKRTIP